MEPPDRLEDEAQTVDQLQEAISDLVINHGWTEFNFASILKTTIEEAESDLASDKLDELDEEETDPDE
jgi:hypothetical protein